MSAGPLRRLMIRRASSGDTISVASSALTKRPDGSIRPDQPELSYGIQQAGTAETNWRHIADHLELDPLGVDRYGFNCAGTGTHAVLDLCALKGRTGGRGRRHCAGGRTQDDFSVRAYVDQQPYAFILRQAGCQQARRRGRLLRMRRDRGGSAPGPAAG